MVLGQYALAPPKHLDFHTFNIYLDKIDFRIRDKITPCVLLPPIVQYYGLTLNSAILLSSGKKRRARVSFLHISLKDSWVVGNNCHVRRDGPLGLIRLDVPP